MEPRWKRIVEAGGILLILPGLLFAFNALCIASLVAFGSGSEPIMYGIVSLTLVALTLGAGGVAYWHADKSLKGKSSDPLHLPPLTLMLAAFGFVLLVGLFISVGGLLQGLFLPPVLLILAVLPPLWAVSWFTPPEAFAEPVSVSAPPESQLTWRRGLVAFCGGATVSVFLAIILEIFIAVIVLVLTGHFTYGFTESLNDLLYSDDSLRFIKLSTDPSFVYLFVQIAIIAPLVEEFVKPLVTRPLLRHLNRQETFWVGALAGAGFAAVENVIYASSGLSIWAGILVVRALGGALHPLGSGLVALGWRDVQRGEPNATEKWLKQYGLAVLIHAVWNGGSLIVIALGSAQFFGMLPEIGGLGISMTGVTLAFLLILGIAALWIGRAYGYNRPLTTAPEADANASSDGDFGLSEQATALWALTCLLALVPMGIAGLRLWLR